MTVKYDWLGSAYQVDAKVPQSLLFIWIQPEARIRGYKL